MPRPSKLTAMSQLIVEHATLVAVKQWIADWYIFNSKVKAVRGHLDNLDMDEYKIRDYGKRLERFGGILYGDQVRHPSSAPTLSF